MSLDRQCLCVFQPTACPGSCTSLPCDISLSSSVDGCSEGDPGCRSVAHTTTLPEATVSGTIACDSPGSNGWCRGAAVLNLSSSEPLDGYSILALEGTHNGATFACSGDACQLSLAEGANNFTFWAVSSYGDTSSMGSASANLDTQPPIISGQITGTAGQNGWYVSAVSVDASASDSGSGLSVLEFSINGASWSAWSGALSLGDGVHSLALQATDVAGNSSSETLTLSVDTQLPELVLNSAASFCPNCGERLEIQIHTTDALSGVNAWELRTGATIITSGVTAVDQTFSWDGSGLPAGSHILVLQVQDAAGNSSSTTHDVTFVLPAVAPPKRSAATATPRPMAISHTPTPSGTSTPTYAAESVFAFSLPTPTRIAVSIPFGGRPRIPVTGLEGNAPGALPGQDPQSGTNAGTTTTNPVLWGGTAAALVAAAMAVGAAERRRRKVKAQRLAQEMERRNTTAEARERAQAQAEAQARREHAAVEAEKAAQWKSRAEAFMQDEELIENLKMEHRMGSTPPVSDLPTAAHAPTGNFRHVTEYQPAPAAAQERSWWQRAWEGVKSIFTSTSNQQTLTSTGTPGATPTPQPGVYTPNKIETPTPPGFHIPVMTRAPAPPGQEPHLRPPTFWHRAADWVDRHQQVVAIGVGVVAGVALIIVTAGTATPLVAAAWTAGIAIVVVTGGTVALNAAHGRSLGQNVGRNLFIASASAIVTYGLGFILSKGGIRPAVNAVGQGALAYCGANPSVCERIEPVLRTIDLAEEAFLMAKGAVQSLVGDHAGAGETAIELQVEYMDGGVPGNSFLDDASEGVQAIVDSDGKLRFLNRNLIEIAESKGDNSLSALLGWDANDMAKYGLELAERSGRDAQGLKALDELISLGDLSTHKAEMLIQEMGGCSINGSGNRYVLGRWVSHSDGFVNDARLDGGVYYESHPEFRQRLVDAWGRKDPRVTEVLWRANEAAVQQSIADGMDFDYSLARIDVKEWKKERTAVRLYMEGDLAGALETLGKKTIPARLKEIQLLMKAGYQPVFDDAAQIIRWRLKRR